MRYPRLVLWSFWFILFATAAAGEHIGIYHHGTIVRMHVGDCLPDPGILGALSGNSRPQATEVCPEYTLMSDKVVYVIEGKPSKDVLPLAQEIEFRIRKNEVAVRVDDDPHEIRFLVREMILRADWDRIPQQAGPVRKHYSMPVLDDQ